MLNASILRLLHANAPYGRTSRYIILEKILVSAFDLFVTFAIYHIVR
jgi:hypothetical protein